MRAGCAGARQFSQYGAAQGGSRSSSRGLLSSAGNPQRASEACWPTCCCRSRPAASLPSRSPLTRLLSTAASLAATNRIHPSCTAGTGSRYDSSLGLLTRKFIGLMEEAEDGLLDLNKAAEALHVQVGQLFMGVWGGGSGCVVDDGLCMSRCCCASRGCLLSFLLSLVLCYWIYAARTLPAVGQTSFLVSTHAIDQCFVLNLDFLLSLSDITLSVAVIACTQRLCTSP